MVAVADTLIANKNTVAIAPVRWCSVSLSDVYEQRKCLKASVFDTLVYRAKEQIRNGKYGFVYLGGEDGLIKSAFYPVRFERVYCGSEYGTPFFLPSQIMDIKPKPCKYISSATECDIKKLQLEKNTLLLTRSGSIGSVAYVSRTFENCVFSDDVIRISCKAEHDTGYVYAFLKSETGQLFLSAGGYGSVITHLEPEHLGMVLIPNAPIALRKKIHDLIVRSYALRDDSNDLIDEATNLFVSALNLPPIQELKRNNQLELAPVSPSPIPPEAFAVSLSDLALRFDASYHAPIVNRIISCFSRHADEIITIDDKRFSEDVILPGRFKRFYVEKDYGRVFIGGAAIGELDPSNKDYLSSTKHKERISKLELHENMILITCSGTIGHVALVPKHWENWTASQHIIRIVPASKDIAGYLYIVLASDYGLPLITRYSYGTNVDEINDDHVRQIQVPLLKDKSVQKRINDLALESNQKRYEAYMLEQEAFRVLNNEIILP